MNLIGQIQKVQSVSGQVAKGAGGGSTSIAMCVDGGYIQYSMDGGMTWTNLIAVADLKGAPGKDGSDATVTAENIAGALGYTPAAPGDIPVVPAAEISANTAARHSHANKGVLDGITAAMTAAWDAKAGTAAATTSANGLMSKADKAKLDGIAAGATKVTVDSVVSASSVNPVQNKAIKQYVDSRAAGSGAVRYDATQSLTFEQKQQARKNIEAADSVVPTITGAVSLCPANITDSNDAVHVTTTKASSEDFTVTLDCGPENALVRVDGIRTPTDAQTNYAANVAYVKAKIAAISAGAALPSVTAADNGKILRVVGGAWAAASLPVYNGGVS